MANAIEKSELSSEEQLEKAKKALKKAHEAQPVNAAKGAIIGGFSAETVALGAMYIKLIGEMTKNANKMGISIMEAKNPHIAQRIGEATFTNPKSIKSLVPFAWGMIAAPFVGSAVGAWINTRWGNQKIDKQHDALDKAQETKWQGKIAAESKEKTNEAISR